MVAGWQAGHPATTMWALIPAWTAVLTLMDLTSFQMNLSMPSELRVVTPVERSSVGRERFHVCDRIGEPAERVGFDTLVSGCSRKLCLQLAGQVVKKRFSVSETPLFSGARPHARSPDTPGPNRRERGFTRAARGSARGIERARRTDQRGQPTGC